MRLFHRKVAQLNLAFASQVSHGGGSCFRNVVAYHAQHCVEERELPRNYPGQSRIFIIVVAAIDTLIRASAS